MGYNIMNLENLPESVQNKPRWMWFLALTISILVITVTTVSVGALLGYTYCYIEHRTTPTTGNVTQSTNLQIIHIPYADSPEAQYNRTINGAILSSVLVSKILNIGKTVLDSDLSCIPMAGDDILLLF